MFLYMYREYKKTKAKTTREIREKTRTKAREFRKKL